jgi:hypothetical protein
MKEDKLPEVMNSTKTPIRQDSIFDGPIRMLDLIGSGNSGNSVSKLSQLMKEYKPTEAVDNMQMPIPQELKPANWIRRPNVKVSDTR